MGLKAGAAWMELFLWDSLVWTFGSPLRWLAREGGVGKGGRERWQEGGRERGEERERERESRAQNDTVNHGRHMSAIITHKQHPRHMYMYMYTDDSGQPEWTIGCQKLLFVCARLQQNTPEYTHTHTTWIYVTNIITRHMTQFPTDVHVHVNTCREATYIATSS